MNTGNKAFLSLHTILYFLLIFISGTPVYAQTKDVAKEFDVDSVLYTYYQRCKNEVTSPVVLSMSDTLFRMASEKNDKRMQAVALCTKVDYFYFKGKDKDSVMHYIDMVKRFAKKNDQPKYYYFIWSKRLITYYIRHNQYNTALYEADKMMKEAQQDNYPAGIANAYNILSSIYQLKKLYHLASEHKEKEIEIIQKYKVDTYNLSNAYSLLGHFYSLIHQMDKAKENLDKSRKCINSHIQEYYYNLRSVQYHLIMKDYDTAWELLQKTKTLIDTQKEINRDTRDYYCCLRDYYVSTNQPGKALKTQDTVTLKYRQRGEYDQDALYNRARLLTQTGNLVQATEYYQKYIESIDSISKINEDITAGEFSAMLDVERLNAEKSELEREIQQRDLTNKKRIIYFLAALLTLGIIVIYREHHLNAKLRSSQKRLTDTNKELLQSRSELMCAKEQAENASIMKTEFIQNMSHEIRTPLNSIVGFSQIVSSMSKDNEETKEYANIIEQSSNNLLQLIEDVLNISNLDSGSEIPVDTLTDATALCSECIDRIKPYLIPGVALKLETEADEFQFNTNPAHLSQILCHLLKNAAKFTKEGQVTLEWHTDKTHKNIIFSVTDTGIGIPIDKQEFIFERFAKIDTFVQGTGLGLPIGRICAEKMGGSLILDTEYTDGSRFILTLPL